MYPVAAFTPRTALKPFEFAGCRVEEGTEVLVANGVTHRLAQFFPNPDVFDINRYSEPRQRAPPAQRLRALQSGRPACLGAGLAEAQIILTMAALLNSVKLALDPPDWELKIKLAPLPSAGAGCACGWFERPA